MSNYLRFHEIYIASNNMLIVVYLFHRYLVKTKGQENWGIFLQKEFETIVVYAGWLVVLSFVNHCRTAARGAIHKRRRNILGG